MVLSSELVRAYSLASRINWLSLGTYSIIPSSGMYGYETVFFVAILSIVPSFGGGMSYNLKSMAVFDKIYQNMLREIMAEGVREVNARTGHETAALPGMSFTMDIEKDGFPLLTLRKIPTKIFIAEQMWFVSGARKPADFLRDYTRI